MKNLLTALALLAFSGPSLAGGAGPASHVVDVTFNAPSVTVHPGDTLRLHMEEAPLENGELWTSATRFLGLRLLNRADEPQGDHGYFMTLSDITYTYKVESPASGTHVLLFSRVNPDRPQNATLWPLFVKVVQ
ncbi:hypothetical protein [Deinococcus sp. UYEF24]